MMSNILRLASKRPLLGMLMMSENKAFFLRFLFLVIWKKIGCNSSFDNEILRMFLQMGQHWEYVSFRPPCCWTSTRDGSPLRSKQFYSKSIILIGRVVKRKIWIHAIFIKCDRMKPKLFMRRRMTTYVAPKYNWIRRDIRRPYELGLCYTFSTLYFNLIFI